MATERIVMPLGTGEPGAGRNGAVQGALAWLRRPDDLAGWSSPVWRRLGVLWVAVSVPFTAGVSAFARTEDTYVFVFVFMAFGAYTLPGLFAASHAVRHAPPGDRASYAVLRAGLVASFTGGMAVLVALATGWGWPKAAFVPGLLATGALHVGGLAMLVRRRSGRRALSVDLIEALASVVAVMAPLVVLWLPAVLEAEARWFTLAGSAILLSTVAATYWSALLWVRLGPGPRGVLEGCAVVAAFLGSVVAALNIAQGVSGFSLPAPPIIGVTALCASTYLLIPLYVPFRLPHGLDRLPPQAQVRGGWLPTVVPLAGLGALLVATAVVADERSWAVPFALGVVSLVALLGGLRQMAALAETRRLYGQVEASADERRRLLAELLERSVDDRRNVAARLHQQAMAAYASFTALAATDRPAPVVARASGIVGDDLKRHAESLRELVLSMRPLDGDTRQGAGLLAPVRAYLDTVYGDTVAPRLTITVADGLVLDWVVETVLLQVVHEALHNVRRHSEATTVRIAVGAAGGGVEVRVADDGVGFDPSTTPEGAGLATMRAAAAVVDGRVAVESRVGRGTTVVARLGSPAEDAVRPPGPALARGGVLHLVPRPDDDR